MPIFEFQCQKCLTVFEELVLSGRKPDLACTKCKSKDIKRLMSAAYFNTTRNCGKSEECENCPVKRYNKCK
ncbi:MAG: FmdB family regulatory protein [Candidatus Peregrinibacteria bacterium GW2011_GWC2_39_14]|nr:MAG: FmdB family regulatory protein [Candidatus Peregrinibacteria bacterium GW2011_GWC2_39_14]